ncbi:MAG: DUF1549 domain-containing protein, partial [Planctomycetaceae bacterium]
MARPESPKGVVTVEIHEGVRAWKDVDGVPPSAFRLPPSTTPAFALADLPRKYDSKGLIADRSNPFLVRLTGRVRLPDGEYRLLLRSRGAARVLIDGEAVAETEFLTPNKSSHELVPEHERLDVPGLRPLAPGDQQRLVRLRSDGEKHKVALEAFVGGKGLRPEIGELSVSISSAEFGVRNAESKPTTAADDSALRAPHSASRFMVLSPTGPFLLTDAGWQEFLVESEARYDRLNAERRRTAGAAEAEYWQRRHEFARRSILASGGRQPADFTMKNQSAHADRSPSSFRRIDAFIHQRLEHKGIEPAALTDDFAFLRRVTLDTVGVVPTPEEIRRFLADPPEERRRLAIDRLLDDPRWADHWVGYWQDVLAENPGILKPTLNNTGPFRWWISESFRDNKPMDRFATELVMMEGSVLGGGPAGFRMATQNDVPMAEKAHVVANAFLGIDLKCARCHDSPTTPLRQEQLFH